MESKMIINKKMVRVNKAIRGIQRVDRKANRDRKLERGSVLRRNIGKVVALSSEELIGTVNEKKGMQTDCVTASDLVARVERAGLTGMSGSGFSVAKKLEAYLSHSTDAGEKIIIINGAECEPGLLHDAWLLRHKSKEILEGAAYVKKVLCPDRMILATRGSAEYTREFTMEGLEVSRVPLRYPMGEEHFLIKQLLGVSLDKTVVPVTRGILMMNVQTIYQIGRILNGSYDGGHYVTLANLQTGEARIAYVKDDSNIEDMLKTTFGGARGQYFAGGGVTHASEVVAQMTFTNRISFAAIVGDVLINNNTPCKKCGGCSKKCPMGIAVKDIVLARQDNPKADISKWNPDQCIHCGTCTYFCAAGKDLSTYLE